MTSSPLLSKWIVYLALVLVYQTARLVQGHPHVSSSTVSPNAFAEVSSPAGSSSAQDPPFTILKLIEAAYKNHELIPPQQWSQRPDDDDDRGVGRTQWRDTLEQQESSNDGMTQYRKRMLLQVSSTTTSMHRNSDEIVFPDGRIPTMLPAATAAAALACRKSTFCENVADYPRQLVNAAIARNASLRFLESVDPMPDIEQRIDATDDVSLCRFREQVVYPQTAENKEKQWLFIVNQDDLKQGIRIEVCSNDGQECGTIDGFAEGYETICKQKFIYRELAAVGNDGNIVKDQFRFPSSCCCHVKFIGDPTARLGLRLNLPANRTRYNGPNVFSTSTMFR
ncbi:protein spaetzle [Temnothorax americanus]|uniref:protein spaetzle n=1 Tax=Temnothorax americanus TaxID=1964332 RepID=UPI0040697922